MERVSNFATWSSRCQRKSGRAAERSLCTLSLSFPGSWRILTSLTARSFTSLSSWAVLPGIDPACEQRDPKKLAPIIERTLILQTTADRAKKLRAKPHKVRRAPPHLSARDAHPLWEMISTASLAASVTESQRNSRKRYGRGSHFWPGRATGSAA